VQHALYVGGGQDAPEREAERVASVIAPSPTAATPMRSSGNGASWPGAEGIVDAGIRSPGEPLDAHARELLEPRFARDLSGVRIHRDARAAASAGALQARAYAVGQHLVFGAGEYAPRSREGRHLIAHELTHVIQQGGEAHPTTADAPVQRFQNQGPWCKNDPVHETIVQESLKKAGLLNAEGKYTSKEAWEYVRGVMWNDDPSGQLFDQDKKRTDNYSSGSSWLWDFERFKWRAISGEKFGSCAPLLARSHFGDLQALHGMASEDGEAPEVTKSKIMMWCEFAYKTATGEIAESDKLSSVSVAGFSGAFGAVKGLGDQTVRQFFGIREVGDTAKRAAGSLLHTIEDSYAGGHAEREDRGGGRRGRIKSFHSYVHQDENKHEESDKFHGGKTVAEKLKNLPGAVDAMEQGTVILRYITQKMPWSEMKMYLEENVFGTVEHPSTAGPGADFTPDPPPPPVRHYH
jgi:hypothetical protein